jgi:hypothetical protein
MFNWLKKLFRRRGKTLSEAVRTYSTVDGTDIDFYIQRDGELERLTSIQHFSFTDDAIPKREVRGTFDELIWAEKAQAFQTCDKLERIILQYISQYGECSYLEFEDVGILEARGVIGVRSITTLVNYRFVAEKTSGWQPGFRVRQSCVRQPVLVD